MNIRDHHHDAPALRPEPGAIAGATVLVVLGTRPEAIKLAPVIRELRKRQELRTLVCTTGQHREMLEQMLTVFKLKPDYHLDVMRPGQSLTQVTTAIMTAMDTLLNEMRVDMAIVQGDTTTAFAAALEAFYHRIPVAHVEAGLRTQDKYNPFPEEINRRLVSPIADLHFAPTELSRSNLLSEGYSSEKIIVTGNTVIDALYYMRSRIEREFDPDRSLATFLGSGRDIVLVTAHRRENFGGGLQQICEAIRALAMARDDIDIVYPVHLNPNVSGPVHTLLQGLANVHLLPPMDYIQFVALMNRAKILLTDSGGIQEEGPALGKPVLVMREVSERPEAILAGSALLVGTDPGRIITAVTRLLDDPIAYQKMARGPNPFGDGKAAIRIADSVEEALLQRQSLICVS